MHYTIDRFEDAGLAVLETDTGESLTARRSELPEGARAGDVLTKLPWYRWQGSVHYAPMPEETEKRRREAETLRASLPRIANEDDIEL